MQDNIVTGDSVRNSNLNKIGDNLYMDSEDTDKNLQELKQIQVEDDQEAEDVGEQLIKDNKTSSGVSVS